MVVAVSDGQKKKKKICSVFVVVAGGLLVVLVQCGEFSVICGGQQRLVHKLSIPLTHATSVYHNDVPLPS